VQSPPFSKRRNDKREKKQEHLSVCHVKTITLFGRHKVTLVGGLIALISPEGITSMLSLALYRL
jgi:hypothetical protein